MLSWVFVFKNKICYYDIGTSVKFLYLFCHFRFSVNILYYLLLISIYKMIQEESAKLLQYINEMILSKKYPIDLGKIWKG
jgi:hypothetical protein